MRVLAGEVECCGVRVKAGQAFSAVVDPKMPLVEIRAQGAVVAEEEERAVCAIVLAEGCFEPPLELEPDHFVGDAQPNQKAISFSAQAMEMMSLLQVVLSFQSAQVKTVAVIGDRKTGKSSLCRFIAGNLHASQDVYLVDTDLGQPMDWMPGFLSLRKLERITCGNTVAWSGQPLSPDVHCSAFVGDYSPEHFVSLFTLKVQQLAQQAKERVHRGVILVNTCGFVRGLGLETVRAVLQAFNPQVIVETTHRGELIVKKMAAWRSYNIIKGRGDFINSKTSVFLPGPLVSSDIRARSGAPREARIEAVCRYFEQSCMRTTLPLRGAEFAFHEHDRKLLLSSEGLADAELALALVGSICALRLSNDLEVPLLLEDVDLAAGHLVVRLQQEFRPLVGERFTITASEYMFYETKGAALGTDKAWQGEVEATGRLGQKTYWSGPGFGVGSKALRKVVSRRKQ